MMALPFLLGPSAAPAMPGSSPHEPAGLGESLSSTKNPAGLPATLAPGLVQAKTAAGPFAAMLALLLGSPAVSTQPDAPPILKEQTDTNVQGEPERLPRAKTSKEKKTEAVDPANIAAALPVDNTPLQISSAAIAPMA